MATNAGKIDYSPELAETICEVVAAGGDIATYCEAKGTPAARSVFRWLATKPEFMALYQAARIIQADAYADQCVKIADGDTDPSKVRNQLNARWWAAERANPKRFGTKVEVGGEVGLNVVVRRFTAEPEPAE
jgi:hypothetical protein